MEYLTAQEIAEVIQPQFADTDVALLASGIQRYQEIGAYCETPVMSEESFELLQTVMSSAGELDQKAPFTVKRRVRGRHGLSP